MAIIAFIREGQITVMNGRRRLEAQLQVYGQAEVLCDGKVITVVRDDSGQLVEMKKTTH